MINFSTEHLFSWGTSVFFFFFFECRVPHCTSLLSLAFCKLSVYHVGWSLLYSPEYLHGKMLFLFPLPSSLFFPLISCVCEKSRMTIPCLLILLFKNMLHTFMRLCVARLCINKNSEFNIFLYSLYTFIPEINTPCVFLGFTCHFQGFSSYLQNFCKYSTAF